MRYRPVTWSANLYRICDAPNLGGRNLNFFFLTVPMNSVHKQCKSTVVQTIALHSAACHKTALSCHVRTMRAVMRAGRDTAQPGWPYHNTKRLCRDTKGANPVMTEKNSVATDFSFTLKRRCLDTKSHVATQNQPTMQHHCRDTKIVSRHQNPSCPKPCRDS